MDTATQAALIVIAMSAPRALLCLLAQLGKPGVGGLVSEPRAWPAMRPPA